MAIFDEESGNLVLHVVFDGAPFSGKTASVEALGRLLERQIVTQEENAGRTLFFDWFEYEGGLFNGRPIQTRVLSVPGQRSLAKRRHTLLTVADVVVFVADSTADRFPVTRDHLKELHGELAKRRRHIPLLLQINKRDAEDALAVDDILQQLGWEPSQRYLETVATLGEGMRTVFVYAISEALKDLRTCGALETHLGDELDTSQLHISDPALLKLILEQMPAEVDSED